VVRPGSTRVPAATRTRLDTSTVTEAWNARHAPPRALTTLKRRARRLAANRSLLPCSRGERPLAPGDAGACHGDVPVLSLRAAGLTP